MTDQPLSPCGLAHVAAAATMSGHPLRVDRGPIDPVSDGAVAGTGRRHTGLAGRRSGNKYLPMASAGVASGWVGPWVKARPGGAARQTLTAEASPP